MRKGCKFILERPTGIKLRIKYIYSDLLFKGSLALRPGTGVVGNKAVAETEPPVFTAALRAVDDAGVAAFKNAVAEGLGNEAAAIAKTEARTETALLHCPRLVSRARQLRVGEAAIMGTHEMADDAAVMLTDLALIMQFKGKRTGVAAAQTNPWGPDSLKSTSRPWRKSLEARSRGISLWSCSPSAERRLSQLS
jgi:hypothetical protein